MNLDQKTRKLLTMHGALHPRVERKGDKDSSIWGNLAQHSYLSQSEEGLLKAALSRKEKWNNQMIIREESMRKE